MSVVICGTVVPRTALSAEAVQALTASDEPSLAGPSPPPSQLVPPPPPRTSPPNLHQQQQPQPMAVDGAVPPPPPPVRQRPPQATQPPLPPPTVVVLGETAAAQSAAPPAPARNRLASKAASDKPPSTSPAPSASGPPKGSSPPKAWAPLALPSVETAVAAAAAAASTSAGSAVSIDGVSAADLAPYGEAELSTALTTPPERLQRAAAETNPFDDRFLVPADAARRVREAVTRLVNLHLPDESGSEGRILEVREERSCDVGSLPLLS